MDDGDGKKYKVENTLGPGGRGSTYEWNGVVRKIEQSKATSWEGWYRICKKVSDRIDGEQSRRIISKFCTNVRVGLAGVIIVDIYQMK